jgi:transposase-like protein
MSIYKRHRFPPDIISYAAWLYYKYNLRRAVTATVIPKIYLQKEDVSQWMRRLSSRASAAFPVSAGWEAQAASNSAATG